MSSTKHPLITAIAAMVACITFASSSASAAEDDPITVNGGTVQFRGAIVNAPCAIDNDSASQTVELGQYRADALPSTGATSSPVGFAVNLVDCAVDTYSKAAVTFNGITVNGNRNALAPIATQAAETTAGGVSIQILQDSTVLAVDGSEASTAKTFTETGGRLDFQAQYVALADAVTPGSANASADFTITYQ